MQNVKVKYTVDSGDIRRAAKDLDGLSQADKKLIEGAKRVRDEYGRFVKGVQSGSNAIKNANNQTRKDLDVMGQGLNKLGGLIVGAFSVGAIISFGQKVLSVTAEFQKLGAVLNTALGSNSAGQLAFAKIQGFAARTNFSVLELTDSFVKLKNSGFEPTTAQLENLADLANSTGKGFDQLTEAIIDAQTGEFERLKEFGILARSEGDKVSFTFKEQTTTVKKTASAIRDYVVGLGDLNGIQDTTARISEQLNGQISNLGDSMDNLFNTIGTKGAGAFSKFIGFISAAVNGVERLIAGDIELARREGLRQQAKVAEEYAQKVKQLASDYQAMGDSAEEANKKAKSFFEQQAGADLKQLYENLRNVQTQIEKLIETSGVDIASPFNLIVESDAKKQFDLLQKQKAEIEALIGVSREYLTQQDKVNSQSKQSVQLTKDQIKELDKLKKLLEDYRKTTQDFDLDFFKSKTDLRAAIFGEDDIIVVQRNAVAAREALTREFQAAYNQIKADGEKLVKAGLLSQDQLDFDLNLKTETFQTELAKIAAEFDQFVEKFKAKGQQLQNPFTELEKRVAQSINKSVEATDLDLKKKREAKEREKELMRETFDLGVSLVNSFFDISAQRREADLEGVRLREEAQLKLVGDNAQAQDFIRERADIAERQIKTRQAKADKAQALFNIAVNTADAIVRTLSQFGIPAGIPFAAIAAAQGAIQAAVVASKPIPKFRDGVIDLKGPGTATSDSIHAMLSRGESVMTAQETHEFRPTLEAIRKGSISPELLNAMAKPNYDVLAKASPGVVAVQENAQTLDKLDRIERALRKQKNVNLTIDKKGFNTYIQSGNHVTKILNNQFPKD